MWILFIRNLRKAAHVAVMVQGAISCDTGSLGWERIRGCCGYTGEAGGLPGIGDDFLAHSCEPCPGLQTEAHVG